MAAATVDYSAPSFGGSVFECYEVRLSALTSDQLETVTLPPSRADSVSPLIVLPLVTTGATSGDPVTVEWVRDSDVAASETVAVRARVGVGGDITGAKLSVFILFTTRASGGLTPPA
jgi:hypothetical protein